MTQFKEQWKENGKDSRPHISLVMNFTKPTENKPALLTFSEVETFLHDTKMNLVVTENGILNEK